MNATSQPDAFTRVWGEYPNYDDIARFEYTRRMWRRPEMRRRLLAHWSDPRHPRCDRFHAWREHLDGILASDDSEAALDAELRTSGSSLRCLAREIPPVFGSFFPAAKRI